jgi:hypothetical protein
VGDGHLNGLARDVQNLILGAADVWGLGAVDIGEENIPDDVPPLSFRQPTPPCPEPELFELTLVEAFVGVVNASMERTSVPACSPLHVFAVLGRLARSLVVTSIQMLNNKTRRGELVSEHAAGELGRKALVQGACQIHAPCVKAAAVALIAVVTGDAIIAMAFALDIAIPIPIPIAIAISSGVEQATSFSGLATVG